MVFDGKTYADRGYWELFFKEMSKNEIKDFIGTYDFSAFISNEDKKEEQTSLFDSLEETENSEGTQENNE